MSVRRLPIVPGDANADEIGKAGATDEAETPRPRRLAPRLAKAFGVPRAERAALIPYLTGGHPDLKTSARLVAELTAAGADIIELGVPFSDPIADGPVIQQASDLALKAGTDVAAVPGSCLRLSRQRV